MTIEELFGTLQQSVVSTWRKHLRTAKYAKHMALDEFYKEMPEKVDALIEAWMGANGRKIKGYENILQSSNMNTLKYLGELKKVCKQGYDLLDDNEELEGLLDDIVSLINSTLYKVKELAENYSYPDLTDYINEALGNVIPKDFMDIWRGKNITIDVDHLKNLRYVFTELMQVHRDKLPTEQEFTNMCSWITNTYQNFKFPEKLFDELFTRFVDIYWGNKRYKWKEFGTDKWQEEQRGSYLVRSEITEFKQVLSDITNEEKEKIASIILLGKAMYLKAKAVNKSTSTYTEALRYFLDKWNITIDEMPDYSNGLRILSKAFGN